MVQHTVSKIERHNGSIFVEIMSGKTRAAGYGDTTSQAYHDAFRNLRSTLSDERQYSIYYADISAWDWTEIKSNAQSNVTIDPYDGKGLYGTSYLGSVFAIMPSGKYYTAYARLNVTKRETRLDEIYFEALEHIASEYGLWIESGEGDPCDLFACCQIEQNDNIE